MATKIHTDMRGLNEVLGNFQKFTQTTIPMLVRRHARLLAVELANRTQPFSVGSASRNAKQLGTNAVNNDLSKVFRAKESLQWVIDKTQNESLRKKLQSALNSGNNRKIAEIFKAVGMIKDYELIAKSGLAAKHKAQRSNRSGRAWESKQSMNIAISGLQTYAKEIQKRVGLSKSSWAECARKIGGIKGDGARGIPAFAKSKNHKSSGTIIDGIKKRNPFITMASNIPWASRILPQSEIMAAHSVVRSKMIKQADKMTKAAAKNNFNPQPPDE
jgi:ribosomal protein S8